MKCPRCGEDMVFAENCLCGWIREETDEELKARLNAETERIAKIRQKIDDIAQRSLVEFATQKSSMVYLVPPSYGVEPMDGERMLKSIERAGRTCYKSEDKITEDSAREFVRMIIKRGHESVLEHEKVTVRIICDRGVSHEIVRHRLASYSQESTRYCNYSADKFGNKVSVIDMTKYLPGDSFLTWMLAMNAASGAYARLIELGVSPQIARSVLPNALKTEIVVTCNLREWRHIFKLRTSQAAHPQMREIMVPLLAEFKRMIPVVFDDIEVDE